MEFKVIYSPRAKIEIFESLTYYFEKSLTVGINFNNELRYLDNALAINPFYEVKYKNVRAIPFNTFPFSLFFTVNEAT